MSRRKLVEWTVFALVCAGMLFGLRWFLRSGLPYLTRDVIPRERWRYLRPPDNPFHVNVALRKRLRAKESRESAGGSGQEFSGLNSCLLLPFPELASPGAPMNAKGSVGDCLVLAPDGADVNAVEVDLLNGRLYVVQTDVYLPGTPGIAFTRVSRRMDGWARRSKLYLSDVYQTYPSGSRFPFTSMDIYTPPVTLSHFQRISPGTGYAGAIYKHSATSAYRNTLIGWNGNGWDMDLPDGTTYVFPGSYYSDRPPEGALIGVIAPSGASLVLTRNRAGDLETIRASDGRWLKFEYKGHQVTALRDSAGESVLYGYDEDKQPAVVIGTNGESFAYRYNQQDEVTAVLDPRRLPVIEAQYDSDGYITRLRLAGSPEFTVNYHVNKKNLLIRIDLTSARGKRWEMTWEKDRYVATGPLKQ
jgi:hypothetical protein